jgi:hypothetical protein
MKRKAKPEQGELIQEKPEAWIVRAAMWTKKECPALEGTLNAGGLHKLCHNGRTIESARGMNNRRRLEDCARRLNATKAEPREKIMCAADAPNPEKYLEKISS